MITWKDIKEEFAKLRFDDKPKQSQSSDLGEDSPAYEWNADGEIIDRPLKEIPPEIGPITDGDFKMMNAKELMRILKIWTPGYESIHEKDGRVDSYSLLTAARCLEEMGLSLMPDGRCPFRVKVDDELAVFKIPKEGLQVLTYRSVSQTVLYLAAWLVQGEGENVSDVAMIDDWIRAATPKDRSAMPQRGMLRWLLSRKRILSKKVKGRAQSQMSRFVHKRADALNLLFRLTLNDGAVTTKRVKSLEKLFPLFGLEPSSVHSELHRFATGQHARTKQSSDAGVVLDATMLKKMEQHTQEAQQVLNTVFSDNGHDGDTEHEAAKSVPIPHKQSKNPMHALLQRLAEKVDWPIDEFSDLCKSLGLLPSATLENLNDISYDELDEPVVEEDGDAIAIDTALVQELLKKISI